jgi:hypothetical protein
MAENVSDRRHMGERPAFDFRRLSEHGVLWLINRAVFHPRGFALALEYADGEDEPFGWSIQGDGTEPWRFDDSSGAWSEDDKFREVEALLRQAAEFGRAPHLSPPASPVQEGAEDEPEADYAPFDLVPLDENEVEAW